MPKHAIRIPARPAAKRVRWMLEVSADPDAGPARARPARKRARPKRKKSPAAAPATPMPPAVASVEPARRSALAPVPLIASDTTAAGMAVVIVVGAIVVGTLALTAYPSKPVVAVARTVPPEAIAPPVHRAAPVAKDARPVSLAPLEGVVETTPVPRAAVEKPRPAPVSSKIVWPPASLKSSPPVVANLAAGSSSLETVGTERTPSTATPAPAPDAVSEGATTMTGCLEIAVEGDAFRLTDVEGTDAPKSRSWRSGFLKKRAAPVELVELSDRAGLRKFVGHRVSATGVLTGRELRVRSFQPAGTSCD